MQTSYHDFELFAQNVSEFLSNSNRKGSMIHFAPGVNLDHVQQGPINILNSFPFDVTVNSAYRSYPSEIEKGRNGTSSHCKGLALDLSCRSSSMRLSIVAHLIRAGVKRIGIANTFIHFDLDPDKPACIWLY